MALSADERKKRRAEGMKKAREGMTPVQTIFRMLTVGRPPASELRTPASAITAANTLYQEIERRLALEGVKLAAGEWAVCVAYVSPDLSVVGFTPFVTPGTSADAMAMLTGNIMLGLVFGITDPDANGNVAVGMRLFLNMKQAEEMVSQILPAIPLEMK